MIIEMNEKATIYIKEIVCVYCKKLIRTEPSKFYYEVEHTVCKVCPQEREGE